jgi:serine/threonine-protein kinase
MPANATANRYELKERLGEGGMGVVYRALDTRTNSYVALKTLRDAADPAMLEMFKREWAELGKVPHPNIVDVRDVDEIEENGIRKPCFIMPLLPGCTLAALIKSSSPRLTTDFVVNIISQVCKGLQAAHEKELIHRDLKPSNIFIMEDDTAKIIDFGLVYTVGNQSATGLKGTWQYMPPEQIDGTKQPNRSFDIFSLGVVAYEALTGHQPFKRAKFEDTVEAVRHFVPQAISERNPKVPQLLSKAVHVAMAKLPMHRYASAREFAETVQKAHQNLYIERFDPAKIRPRIDRAKKAFTGGDSDFASEILTELEAEGNLDTEITLLRAQIDEYNKHKRIRQLFEAAQTRLEQDEIPLALEKLEEILKIDPQNSDTLELRKRVEQQRSQQQVSEWLDLARKHLDRHDFSEARRALKEVFNLKYDDPEAARLKAQVDTREKEVETARNEKEHLYSFALRHNEKGEISSALSKLEKLLELSRNLPGASVPERDKVFQAFYNDVRTERDRIDNAYSEGTRLLAEKHFEKALQLCDTILTRYPQNPQFQALRLKIEHSQRQELSAYIAEVGRAVETEPNLDRRVGLLEEACKRYPNEGQFSRQLSLARELRDLVASIAARARAYEEQCQFAEAIAQWNTLSNIHPQYPGIDFEINQLERRREQQSEEDKKSRLVEKIDRALGNAAYADAERLSQEGLLEFPQNPELLALLRLSRQALEQSREANRLFEEAKIQRASGDWDRAVALLRQALQLEKRNIVVLNTLVNLLVERAHALLDTNAAAAEPLAAEADQLDPDHPHVKKVIALIAQAKRKHYVEQTVLQARELQTVDRGQAINVLQQGLSVYPGDGRLQQTLTNLQREAHALDATIMGSAPEDKTFVYSVGKTQGGPISAPPVKPPAPPPIQPKAPEPTGPPRWQILRDQVREAGAVLAQNLKERSGIEAHNLKRVLLGLLAFVVLLALVYWYFHRAKAETAATPAIASTVATHPHAATYQVKISTDPSDATVTLDNTPVSGITPPLTEGSTHRIAVSRLGYQTIENSAIKVNGPNWSFALPPEPLHISVSVSESNGTVWLDNQHISELTEGTWASTYPLKPSPEQHVLSVKNKAGQPLFKIKYKMAAGKLAIVDPLQTNNLLVASSLGKKATLYSGNAGSKLALPGHPQRTIPADGILVNVDDAKGNFPIASGKQVATLTVGAGSAPALSVSLNAPQNLVQITLSVTPKTAKLLVDGGPMASKKAGVFSWTASAGSYKAKLTAAGMTDQDFNIVVKKGKPYSQKIEMIPAAVKGPPPSSLLIAGATAGATVSIDDSAIGELDEKGNGSFPGISPGTHKIQLSKTSYSPATFYGIPFSSNKPTELHGNLYLNPITGYARLVSIKPADATVFYKRSGAPDKERRQVLDFSKVIPLQPGKYEFSVDAPKYVGAVREVTIPADQTAALSFELQPVVGTETKSDFVSANDVTKINGDWYHGNSNNYIPLVTRFKINTILFSKQFKVKHMTWGVFLDSANTITYTLDNKGISIARRIDGVEKTDKIKDVDLNGIANASNAWAAQMKLEKNEVILAKQDGTPVDSTHDDGHDWSHAKIVVKGDAYFTLWPGR